MAKIFTHSPSSVSSLAKAKRGVALGLKRTPLLSWLYDTRDVNQLLLVPRDLRTADPSLSIELDMGQFGLAGATVLLEGRSPFHMEPPNLAWAKELHGFSWVRNLRAARSERALNQALDLTEHWLNSFKSRKGLPWQPDVAARRLISWLSYSNFLLHEADETSYMDMMISIDDHMRYLSMSGVHAEPGMPRLLSLIALVFAGLCVANQEKFAEPQIKYLCAELDRQILPDGGHISRDNSLLASILLDLLPLKQCFVTRNIEPPEPLIKAIDRMLPMIHYLRLGDGLMSRFNGSGTTLPDTLSTAIAYDDVLNEPLEEAGASNYYRLQQGNVIVLMDGGSAPILEQSQRAHAGCLSFEMSSGSCPVIINCGAAPPAYQTMAHNARASVSHSTLTINNRSSAEFLHDKTIAKTDKPSLLQGPAHVQADYVKKDRQVKIVGSHDGYLDQFGLIHHRLLNLSQDGYTLNGEDWIEVPNQDGVIQKGLGWPYAVHFHIHPDVKPARAADGKSVTLTLADSQEWKLYAGGAVILLEESTFYADFAGPCLSVQAVIRGNCVGQTSIPWKLTKTISSPLKEQASKPSWLSENIVALESPTNSSSKDKPALKKLSPKSADQDITDLVEDDGSETIDKDQVPSKKSRKRRGKSNKSANQRAKKPQFKSDKDSKSEDLGMLPAKTDKKLGSESDSLFSRLEALPTLDVTISTPPPPLPEQEKAGPEKEKTGPEKKETERKKADAEPKDEKTNKGAETSVFPPEPPPLKQPRKPDEIEGDE